MKWYLCTAMLMILAIVPAWAGGDDENEDEIPFDVATVYFELNDTDGDLGIHALIDGGPWKRLAIEGPNEAENLKIRLKSRLRRQGLTELFFESAEPTFDELSPTTFFARFPEGEYEVEGMSLDGEELESTADVTHLIPAPVGDPSVNGTPLPEDCDEGPVPVVDGSITASWDAVTHSHPDLGRTDEPIEVERYQLVMEQEEPELVLVSILVPPGVTSVEVPEGLFAEGEVKIEILTRESSGNQSATESCFEVE